MAMEYMSSEMGKQKSWNLYGNNCTQWAKSVTDHVGVDTGKFWNTGLSVSPYRPMSIYGKMDNGMSGLTLPEDLENLKKNDKNFLSWEGGKEYRKLKRVEVEKKKQHAKEHSEKRKHLKEKDVEVEKEVPQQEKKKEKDIQTPTDNSTIEL